LFPTENMDQVPTLQTSLLVLVGFAVFFYILSSLVVEKTGEKKST